MGIDPIPGETELPVKPYTCTNCRFVQTGVAYNRCTSTVSAQKIFMKKSTTNRDNHDEYKTDNCKVILPSAVWYGIQVNNKHQNNGLYNI